MDVLEISMEARDVIKKIIAQRSISSRSLSVQIGISEQSISKMLNGKLTLTDKTLVRMAKALDVPFEMVKYGEGLEEYILGLSVNETNTGSRSDQTYISQHKGKDNQVNYQSNNNEGVIDPEKIRLVTENQMLREQLQEYKALVDRILKK